MPIVPNDEPFWAKLILLLPVSLEDDAISKIASLVKCLIFCLLALFAPRWLHLDHMAWNAVENPIAALTALAAVELCVALIVLYIFARSENRSLKSYGLGAENLLGSFAKGTITGALMVLFSIGTLYLLGYYKPGATNPSFDCFFILPFLIAAALREEVVFRGYLQQTMERTFGTWAGLTVAAIAFGFIHLLNFTAGVPLGEKLYSCLMLSLDAGLLFGLAYLKFRNLWFPLGIHMAWNLFEGPVLGTPISSLNLFAPLIKARLEGPIFWTGGNFGPEASLPMLFFCLLISYGLARGVWPFQGKSIKETEKQDKND